MGHIKQFDKLNTAVTLSSVVTISVIVLKYLPIQSPFVKKNKEIAAIHSQNVEASNNTRAARDRISRSCYFASLSSTLLYTFPQPPQVLRPSTRPTLDTRRSTHNKTAICALCILRDALQLITVRDLHRRSLRRSITISVISNPFDLRDTFAASIITRLDCAHPSGNLVAGTYF